MRRRTTMKTVRGIRMTRTGSPLWLGAASVASLLLLQPAAGGEDVPKRGGTLEFAVTVEPGNYDCHGNTSFAFLHPVDAALLDLAEVRSGELPADRRRSGALLDRVARPTDLYLQAAAERAVPRRVETDLGRYQGEL